MAFPWFDQATLFTQFVGNVLLYGGVLGLFLGWRFAGIPSRQA